MVWEPFALAVLFGLLISAGIYFVVMWPQVAPDDDALDAADGPALAVASPAIVAAGAVDAGADAAGAESVAAVADPDAAVAQPDAPIASEASDLPPAPPADDPPAAG